MYPGRPVAGNCRDTIRLWDPGDSKTGRLVAQSLGRKQPGAARAPSTRVPRLRPAQAPYADCLPQHPAPLTRVLAPPPPPRPRPPDSRRPPRGAPPPRPPRKPRPRPRRPPPSPQPPLASAAAVPADSRSPPGRSRPPRRPRPPRAPRSACMRPPAESSARASRCRERRPHRKRPGEHGPR